MGNLIWIWVMLSTCAAAWFGPHWLGPFVVMWSWVFGTWWGYLTAQGERE
jgi:hypothetical protein